MIQKSENNNGSPSLAESSLSALPRKLTSMFKLYFFMYTIKGKKVFMIV